jgi:hypothetical protein
MIVDTSPKRRIKEGGNHVELGRQLYGTPFTVTMSPTSPQTGVSSTTEDFELKVNIAGETLRQKWQSHF